MVQFYLSLESSPQHAMTQPQIPLEVGKGSYKI